MAGGTPRTKAAQREATVARLVAVGRDRFARAGYAQTPTEEIVRRAGVTRGALYHHFGSKEGLFAAVLADVQRDVAHRVATAAAKEENRWRQLRAGCHAFLRASLDPEVQRIALIDAPAVLGWEAWRRADAAASMPLLADVLAALAADGTIAPPSVEALTHLLSGAMNEAALWIARAAPAETERALAAATATLDLLLDALPRPPAATP